MGNGILSVCHDDDHGIVQLLQVHHFQCHTVVDDEIINKWKNSFSNLALFYDREKKHEDCECLICDFKFVICQLLSGKRLFLVDRITTVIQ